MKKQKLLKDFLDTNFFEYEQNAWLKNHTNFKIGGKAKFIVFPSTMSKMLDLLNFLQLHNIYFYVLGAGTNILCSDYGYDGVIISTKKLNGYQVNENKIITECGLNLFALNKLCVENSLTGLEFSYGIPGSVGGAIFMNAGTSGLGVGNFVESVTVFDGKQVFNLSQTQMKFGYRKSVCKEKNYIVLMAIFVLKKGKKDSIIKTQSELLKKRKETQPYNMACAGSVFKRLDDGNRPVSKMIDDLGLKGFSIGGAQISIKHAGFIVNQAQATCKDVLNLIKYIRKRVKSSFGAELELEIELLGECDDFER